MEKSVNFKKISIYDTPARSPGYLLWHISISWRSSLERVLKKMDLTHPQFVVLASLGWLTRKGARVSQVAIGQMAGLDPNTTSQIIRGLEQKKLIKRRPSLDSRAKNPILTPQGSRILAQALPAVEKADTQFFSGLNGKELNGLVEIFQKITTHSP
jgi:DNA-binding MarR family transcriptional regulator